MQSEHDQTKAKNKLSINSMITCPKCKYDFAYNESLDLARQKELNTEKEAIIQAAVSEREKELEIRIKCKYDELNAISSQHQSEKMKEKELELEAIRDSIRKTQEQACALSSQQQQGEAREQVIQEIIRDVCPKDRLEPVPVGKKGADIVQHVVDESGNENGRIVYETKKVKNWKDDFVRKLKSDKQLCKANVAVLVSTVFPKGATSDPVQLYQGIVLVKPHMVKFVAQLLRWQVVRVWQANQIAIQRGDFKETLYDHIFSSEFVDQLNQIYSALNRQHEELRKEKAYSQQMFARREKTLDQAHLNYMTLVGGLQGLGKGYLPGLEQIGATPLRQQAE